MDIKIYGEEMLLENKEIKDVDRVCKQHTGRQNLRRHGPVGSARADVDSPSLHIGSLCWISMS